MRLSTYLKIFPCPDSPDHLILYSTRRCSVARVPAALLRSIGDGTLSSSDRETLARFGILVSDPAVEREELFTRFDQINKKRRRFDAIVVVNLDCNLACPYCFEEGVRGKHAMSAATSDLLVEWIEGEQFDRGRKVNLAFYGGEPLLSHDLIAAIATRLRTAAGERQLSFEFSLVTNGTLLAPPLVRELTPLGLTGAKVTLDGPREIHDRSRPFGSGKGSFDAIVGNIREVCNLIKVHVGGNFSRENYREFPRLLDSLLDNGITPEKIGTVQFSPVTGRVGGAGIPDYQGGCNCANEEWLYDASLFLREEILRRGFSPPKPGPAGCMVEFGNDLVINLDGTFYKCPAFVGREGFAVGDLRRGIVGDGAAYGPGAWKKPECLDCAYLPQCFGGCSFLKFLRDGNIDGVDCWKPFLDATLEQCIRQDLRYRPRKS